MTEVGQVIPVSGGTQLPLILRPMSQDDRLYVIHTWVKSASGRRCTGPADYAGQIKLCEALVERCPVMIAAFDEDPRTVIGWACTDASTVHYVYVRGHDNLEDNNPGFRRMGIAKLLLRDYLSRTDVRYTHAPSRNWQRRDTYMIRSSKGMVSVPPVPPGWIHDPYLAFEVAATVPAYREPRHKPSARGSADR